MKNTLVLSVMLLSVFGSQMAFAANGDCTKTQLINAVQKKCGAQVRYTNGRIGHYQGEVTDSYIMPVRDGKITKNMKIDAEGGNCQDDYITVDSTCP